MMMENCGQLYTVLGSVKELVKVESRKWFSDFTAFIDFGMYTWFCLTGCLWKWEINSVLWKGWKTLFWLFMKTEREYEKVFMGNHFNKCLWGVWCINGLISIWHKLRMTEGQLVGYIHEKIWNDWA